MLRTALISLMAATAAALIGVLPAMGADQDCSDFGSQASAQKFFLGHGGPGRDSHALDDDHDGLACETNGAPYRGLLSLKNRSGDFKGRLKAVTGSCEDGRRIKVYEKRDGRDRLVGKDDTNNRGRYKVHEAGANGRFYAKSKPEGNCERDRSFKTIHV